MDSSVKQSQKASFNRTFMELKSKIMRDIRNFELVLIVPLWNWNEIRAAPTSGTIGFNRTFMELKFVNGNVLGDYAGVLIVPLWNWNFPTFCWIGCTFGFNRTFMELKSFSVENLVSNLKF